MEQRANDLLTIQQGADYLGISRFKMARLIADGEIDTFATPLDRRRKLVKKADLDALVGKVERIPEGEWRSHKAAA